MGKSIISNQEGQNLFPGIPTLIKGNKSGTPITMKNTSPQIAVTPYGASYMMPNQDYNFAGNSVLELPLQQMGGQDQQDQLMQLLQAYAQMKGMKPEELIQKLQSLSQEQQQQAIQAIAQEVQGQAGGGEDVDQDQMSEGGEPCFGCYDHYNPSPQAQDLNWFYKAQRGMQVAQRDATNIPAVNTHAYDSKAIPTSGMQMWNIVKNLPALGLEKLTFDMPVNVWNHVARAGEKMGLAPNQDWWPQDTVRFNQYTDQLENRVKLGLTPAQYEMKLLNDKQNKRWEDIKRTGTWKQEGGAHMMDDFYQAGRQKNSNVVKDISSEYQPNWFARRTSVPGAVLGAIPNFLPFWGSHILSTGKEILGLNQGSQFLPDSLQYLPEDAQGKPKLTYGDLSKYMINRRYANVPSDPMYDAMIQDMSPAQRKNLSGPIFKEGGDAFPQAQMYLPNEKPHETRPNFMFQQGGSTDIDQIYQIMKAGGLDMNPRKKKGGKFDPFNFQDYVRKNGGGLSKYQSAGSADEEESFAPLAQPSMLLEKREQEQQPNTADPYSRSAQKEAAVNSYVTTGALPQGKDASRPYNPYNNPTDYKPQYDTDAKGGAPYTPSKKTRNWGEFNNRGAATEVGALGLLNAATKSMFNNPQPKTPNMSSETYGMYAPTNAMGDYMTNTGVLQPNMYGSPQNMGRPTSQTNIAYGNTQYAQMGGNQMGSKMRDWEDGQIVDSEYLTPEDIFSIYAAGGTIEYI